MNFFEFLAKFPTEEACIQHFIKIRYGEKVKCNHCNCVDKVYHMAKTPKNFICYNCNNTFSVFTGTIFEHSPTDLRKWLYAIHLFLNGKKGISGYQLQREIAVTYKTAWRMLKQIRIAMGNQENPQFINAIIEIDETYIDGKPRKKNSKKDDDDNENKPKRGRGTKKEVVIGCFDRMNKIIFAKVGKKNKDGKKLTGKQLLDVLNQVATQKNTVITDEFKAYNILDKKTNHIHLKVDHTKEFVSENGVHTNTIESFWATLKRGILGIYHHVSADYLQSYVNEFCFRYNNRKNDGMFDLVLKQSIC